MSKKETKRNEMESGVRVMELDFRQDRNSTGDSDLDSVINTGTASKIDVEKLIVTDSEVIPITSITGKLPNAVRTEIELNIENADMLLNLAQVPVERTLGTIRVNELHAQMLQGTFDFGLVNLSSASFNGVNYRMNGQHTCMAFKQAMTDPSFALATKRKPIMVSFLRYKCSSEESLHRVYATQNTTRGNSKSQMVNAAIFGQSGYEDTGLRTRNLMQAAISGWKHGFEAHKTRAMRPDDISYTLLSPAISEISGKIAGIMKGGNKTVRHLRRSAVVAAMYETFSKDPLAAKCFWEDVKFGSGLDRNDPRLRLYKELWGSNTVRSGHENVSEEIYRLCMGCWNLHRSGKDGNSAFSYKIGKKGNKQPRPVTL